MKTKSVVNVGLIIFLGAVSLSLYFYPELPTEIPSHWNAAGEVDDYLPRIWGAFLLPVVMLVMLTILTLIPRIDPLRKNIKKFQSHYNKIIILLELFLLVVHVQILAWALGYQVATNVVYPIALGILFFFLGDLLHHSKRNWIIGIRNPWTLSSDTTWDKTHQLGAKLFKAVGVITLLGVFMGELAIILMIVPIIAVAIFLFVYSYFVYKKEKENH